MSSRFPRPGAPAGPRGPVAPVHRSAQALPAAQQQYAYSASAPNAALLIDFDNVTMGIREDMKAELRSLLSSDIIRGKVSVQRAYADWRRYPQYVVPLAESSIDMIMAPAYGSSKKNATDIRLAVDAMELVFTRPEIGTFILLSGDSDFSSLVIKLKEYGKYVIGVGIRESASDLLVQNCDEYYSYNALAGLVKTTDEETKRWDPWELVAEAVQRMERQGDVMRADRLKQVMQDIDGSFDEKDLGMAKFSRFVTEAQQRGLLTLTRLESGQYEIAPGPKLAPVRPAAPPTDRAAVEADIDTESADAERERGERLDRGRRRGRGRGRGREVEREPGRYPREDGEAEAEEQVEPKLTVDAVLAPPPASAVGVSGERLTRAEAFDLVRRAVESLTAEDADTTVTVPVARARAFELLGRDSESLAERMFERIVRDAGDAGLVEVRRHGDAYELARAQAPSVGEQLNRAAAAAQPAPLAGGDGGAARGMGPRGLTRGRGPRGAGGPPPELLLLGAVQPAGTLVPPAAASVGADAGATFATDNGAPVDAVATPAASVDVVPANVVPGDEVAPNDPDADAVGPGASAAGDASLANAALADVTPVDAAPTPALAAPIQPNRGNLRGRARGRGGRGGRADAPPPDLLLTGAVTNVAPVAPVALGVPAPVTQPSVTQPSVTQPPVAVPVVAAVTPPAATPTTSSPVESAAPPADSDAPSTDESPTAVPASDRPAGRGRHRGRGGARKAAAKQPAAPSAPTAAPSVPVAAKQPVAKQPVAKQPVAKQPVAKQPAAKQPAAKQAVARQPSAAKQPTAGARKNAPRREPPAAPPTAPPAANGRPAAKRGARKAPAKQAE